ncbi:MAG TPA: hypothetical protein VL171_16530 [Verrucomicrobiae bacterium]|nr:hypothetical protein [Verrucomicrobiae bacterium]
MSTFQEYQSIATSVPLALRNNRSKIELPILGLQQEAGKIGSMLQLASASGELTLTRQQRIELRDRLSDMLWYTALVCDVSKISLQDVADYGVLQLREKRQHLDPDRR